MIILIDAPDITFYSTTFEHGYFGISSIGKHYILAAYGKDVSLGLLKSTLASLTLYFTEVLEKF